MEPDTEESKDVCGGVYLSLSKKEAVSVTHLILYHRTGKGAVELFSLVMVHSKVSVMNSEVQTPEEVSLCCFGVVSVSTRR
jgi:hypothetical protein